MTGKLQHVSKIAVPALLMAMMAGCASLSDLEKVQQQVDEVKATATAANATATTANVVATSASATASNASAVASDANTVASSAMATAKESKALASDARSLSDAAAATSAAAEKTSTEASGLATEASGLAATAAKASEKAVGVAVQAQKSMQQATIIFPVARMNPATGLPFVQWVVWPSMSEYKGVVPAPAAAAHARKLVVGRVGANDVGVEDDSPDHSGIVYDTKEVGQRREGFHVERSRSAVSATHPGPRQLTLGLRRLESEAG